MWKIHCIILSFLNAFPLFISSQGVSNSPVGLSNLARVEIQVYSELKSLMIELERKINIIKPFIEDFEESTGKSIKDVQEGNEEEKGKIVSSHPLLVYRMMRRFAYQIRPIEDAISNEFEKKTAKRIIGLKEGRKWPDFADLGDTIVNLFRLQSINLISPEQIAQGLIFKDISSKIVLTLRQAFEIGKFASEFDYFTLSFDWFNYVASMLKIEPQYKNDDLNEMVVTSTIQDTVYKHDSNWEKYNSSQTNRFILPSKIEKKKHSSSHKKKFIPKSREKVQNNDDLNIYEPFTNSTSNLIALCSGKELKSAFERKSLFCWRDSSRHPYFIINPLKIEMLNQEPPLVQVYEVLSSQMAHKMRMNSLPLLEPPPYEAQSTPKYAEYAWLTDEEFPQFKSLVRKIELITGLHALGKKVSSPLQVVSYSFGGYVDEHCDAYGDNIEDPIGDRILTFLIYMNKPVRGGETVFPIIGVAANPVPGSAIFWNVTHDDGEVDRKMLHASCPVVQGEKWIVTKWIHLNENFRTRPCFAKSQNIS